jgi:hypothetical protein
MDGEGGGDGVRGDADDAAAFLQEVFEDREVGLVVNLAPSLVLNAVMFKSLKTVDANVEVGGVKN